MTTRASKFIFPSKEELISRMEYETPKEIADSYGFSRQVMYLYMKKKSIKYTPRPLIEMFYKKVVLGDNTDRIDGPCHVWTGAKVDLGYGRFGNRIGGLNQAHAFIFEYTFGPIPKGLCVLHDCDNPSCVNPQHLSIGTKGDNFDDMMRKGRGHNKLNKDDKKCLLEEYNSKNDVKSRLIVISSYAEKYGVTTRTIRYYLNEKSRKKQWKDPLLVN